MIAPLPLPSMRCHWPDECSRGLVHPGPCDSPDLELTDEQTWREHVMLDYGEHTYRDWSGNVLKLPADPADR